MTAAFALYLVVVQTPRFHAGDHWAMDRTIRFLSTAAEIDMQNDDHFEFVVRSSDGRLFLEVSRRQTGTHLSGGALIPAPAGGEPERWQIPIAGGKLTLGRQPADSFERTLAEVLVSVWNGSPAERDLLTVTPVAADRERVTYDGAAIQRPEKLEGDATFDPVSRAPILISLVGQGFTMPGGTDRVSVKVEYRRPPAG